MTEYRGFEIDSKFKIFKDGRQYFKFYYQQAANLEDAKKIIDMSMEELNNYNQRQLNKHGNVLQEPEINPDGSCELENGSEEMQRLSEWNHEMAEQQILQHEKD